MAGIGGELARVTYRATLEGRCDAAIHLVLPPEAATLVDAWARFAAVFPELGPDEIEIEIRPLRPVPDAPRSRLSGGRRRGAAVRLPA